MTPSAEAAARRQAVQIGAAMSVVVLLALVGAVEWTGGKALHTGMEAVATLLALFVGILALVRYNARPRNSILFIGTAFLGTALLDCYHAVVTSAWFDLYWPTPPPSLIPWSWNASRFFLAVLLLLSARALSRERRSAVTELLAARGVYVMAGAFALLTFAFFALVPLPRAYYPELPIGRPEELIAAVIFLASLMVYLREGTWRSDAFEQWVVVSLILGLATQALVMPFSFQLFDGMFDLAHALKIASYGCVLIGSFASLYELVRLSEAAADELARSAESLRTEVAERVRAEEDVRRKADELERSNRELDDFAYIASHDLKEPLRGIHNFSGFLIEDYGDRLDDDGRQKLDTLMSLSQRMEALIEALLFYSRLGRTELAVAETDLDEAVGGVIESLRIRLDESGVELRCQPLPSLVCDSTRVGEVFRNLITNALKYNDKPQPRIEIGCETDDSEPVFWVRDNGIGIADKHRDAVFKIFKRLHARDRYGGGTGAGLTIVKKVVEQHGGRVWIESVPGEGSTFFFTLPCPPQAKPDGRAESAPAEQ